MEKQTEADPPAGAVTQRTSRYPLRPRILIIALLTLAAVVRCVGLGRLDLGTDEAFSFLTATSERGVRFALQNDTNMPLYFYLLKGWIAIFGTSLEAMRLLSVVFGAAAVGALVLTARQCGASWRTTTWTALLAAFTPVQLHYAQLARGYTLACLLLTLGLWSFVRALQSRRASAWVIHGAIIVLGAWTHALFIPLTAGFVFAALLMGVPARQLRTMGIAYGLSAILALPALLLALHQARASGGMAWLRDYWLSTPPALAIPRSLAILALGGNMPRYLLSLPLAWPLQLLALGLVAVAAGAFFWPRREAFNAKSARHAGDSPLRPWRWLFVVFTFWPLVFIWCYSVVCTPIYLVGRYDLFAQPAYLLLLATGFSRLQAGSIHRLSSWFLPAIVCTVLGAGIYGRWEFPLDPQIFHHAARVSYLGSVMKPGEPIICTGLEASPTLYWMHQRRLVAKVSTFPRETMTHLGWLINDDDIVARRDEWPAEILHVLSTASPAGTRVWVLLDGAAWHSPGDFVPSPRQALALSFVSTALANGWRLAETDPSRQAAQADLRIVSLVKEDRPKSAAAD